MTASGSSTTMLVGSVAKSGRVYDAGETTIAVENNVGWRIGVMRLLHWQGKVKSTLHRQDRFWVPRPTTSKTPQHRRLHLLRIPNHNFDYSVLPPLETYFAQDDHVPGQSCPGHCPPTLHRITMNLCNVALLLLPHIVPTCVVRGVRGWGRVRETRTKPDRRERAGRGVARRGAIPGKTGREPPGGGEQGLPGIAPRAHPQWPSAAEAPIPSGRTKVLQLELHVVLMGKVLLLGENHGQLCTGSSSGWAKLHSLFFSTQP
jgi:hypothetical protein